MFRPDRLLPTLCLLAAMALPADGQEGDGPLPAPPAGLAAVRDDDRAYLLRKQQEIFRLNVETDYALALQKLCQTGYGDPRLCQPVPSKAVAPAVLPPSASPPMKAPPAVAATEARPYPILQEISGVGRDLTAILLFQDGRRVTVRTTGTDRARTPLPGGASVQAIEADRVVLRRPGQEPLTLLLSPAAFGEAPFPAASATP